MGHEHKDLPSGSKNFSEPNVQIVGLRDLHAMMNRVQDEGIKSGKLITAKLPLNLFDRNQVGPLYVFDTRKFAANWQGRFPHIIPVPARRRGEFPIIEMSVDINIGTVDENSIRNSGHLQNELLLNTFTPISSRELYMAYYPVKTSRKAGVYQLSGEKRFLIPNIFNENMLVFQFGEDSPFVKIKFTTGDRGIFKVTVALDPGVLKSLSLL